MARGTVDRQAKGGRQGGSTSESDLAPTIEELQAAGCESLRAIAAGLDECGIGLAPKSLRNHR